ncbi:hypothetical protein [Siphonobacter sp. SORGH_AS_1065]|uniref:hypothetical protein n=1 Tax=Siphonobacter sp. SORGH_AS_1065 TaxID=3041795 RepID=UPI0027831DD0|nr:hypothetical protein [Siphonobacter sp. SORGH_AS_1065]MDQ1087811.1 hypothetical protein [Siphonobacter sp. SORGH_AS_1065]
MKRIQPLMVLMLFMILMVACTQPGDQFMKSWKTTDVDIETVSGLPPDTADGFPPESYLNFYPGGRVVCYTRSGHYRMFDWEISADEQTIYLKRQALSLPNLQLKIYTLFPNYWSAKLPGLDSVRLFKYTTVFTHEDHDLLDPKSNTWRLRPDHRLSDAELKAKVGQHIQYAAHYFDIVVKREQGYFEPRFINLPVRFYRGAVGIQKFAGTKLLWRQMFYDDQEAIKALRYYEAAFRSLRSMPPEKDMLKGLRRSFSKMAETFNE